MENCWQKGQKLLYKHINKHNPKIIYDDMKLMLRADSDDTSHDYDIDDNDDDDHDDVSWDGFAQNPSLLGKMLPTSIFHTL